MYTIGTKLKDYYPIWSPTSEIIAECLNHKDAKTIIDALNLVRKIKKLEEIKEELNCKMGNLIRKELEIGLSPFEEVELYEIEQEYYKLKKYKII